MAQFARIGWQIQEHRLVRVNHLRVPKLNPFFAKRKFEAIGANRSDVMTIFWPQGSTGVQRYGCIPQSAAEQLGRDPSKFGSPKSLV